MIERLRCMGVTGESLADVSTRQARATRFRGCARDYWWRNASLGRIGSSVKRDDGDHPVHGNERKDLA